MLKGWGQPLADGVKNFMKEETMPDGGEQAALPARAGIGLHSRAARRGRSSRSPRRCRCRGAAWTWCVADLPVGYLYILALASLGVYGVVLAGWSSNNKYALLGGLRSSAQMISYEIALGMSTIPVLLLAGNVTLERDRAPAASTGVWNVLSLSVACVIFIVSAFAETNRLPFDLPEAESELIAGYHTEYSAMKFSLFFIAEYANMVTASALMVTLFFGGWTVPFWPRSTCRRGRCGRR